MRDKVTHLRIKWRDNKEDYESYAKSNTLGLSTNTPLDEDIFVKVLGMNWNTHDDEIIFSFTELYNHESSLPLTKRSVLKDMRPHGISVTFDSENENPISRTVHWKD